MMDEEIRKIVEQIKRDIIEACAKRAEVMYDDYPAPRVPRMGDDGSEEMGWHMACSAVAEAIRKLA